jgi:hypothetical protein
MGLKFITSISKPYTFPIIPFKWKKRHGLCLETHILYVREVISEEYIHSLSLGSHKRSRKCLSWFRKGKIMSDYGNWERLCQREATMDVGTTSTLQRTYSWQYNQERHLKRCQ